RAPTRTSGARRYRRRRLVLVAYQPRAPRPLCRVAGLSSMGQRLVPAAVTGERLTPAQEPIERGPRMVAVPMAAVVAMFLMLVPTVLGALVAATPVAARVAERDDRVAVVLAV